MKSQLLALSFDGSGSPAIDALDVPEDGYPAGAGFAWYPESSPGVVLFKDPNNTSDTPLSHVLGGWERFRGGVFVCHFRGGPKRAPLQDTHPFTRSYAGRDWVLVQSGQLEAPWQNSLPLGYYPAFEPVGSTDSEHILCWILAEYHRRQLRHLGGMYWSELHALLQEVNRYGTANLLISDGHDLVIYRDAREYRSLCWTRRSPPHESPVYSSDHIRLDLSNPADENRTVVIVATEPLDTEPWFQLVPGQMMVFRGAQEMWRSEGAPIVQPVSMPAGAPPVGGEWRSVAGASPGERYLVSDPVEHRHGTPIGPPDAARVVSVARPEDSRPAGELRSRVLRVVHETVYAYEVPVESSAHVLRLRPTHDPFQDILATSIDVDPGAALHEFEDVFGNQAHRMKIETAYDRMVITADSTVRIGAAGDIHPPAKRTQLPLVWMPWQRQMMLPYLLPPELPEAQLQELSDYAMSFAERRDFDLVDTLTDINHTIHREFAYISGSTTLETTPFEVYAHRRGVCQDFANLFICIARLLNIPARYRVGYIFTGGDYANQLQSEASHAWVETYLPWVGWIGFDPTNGCLASLDHLRVAVGRNYRDATPTSGTIFAGGGGETLSVSVKLEVQEET